MQQQNNYEELIMQDINYNHGLLTPLLPLFEVGDLHFNEQGIICKFFHLKQLKYDEIVSQGLMMFDDKIQHDRQTAEINRQSLNNNGIIQFIRQGELPLFYYHQHWEFTLQGFLFQLQNQNRLMNWDTAIWISKSIAQIIAQQHQESIFMLNISVASVVFRKDFDFSLIQYNENENMTEYYLFILQNFGNHNVKNKDVSLQYLENQIQNKFNKQDSEYILNEKSQSVSPNPESTVQIFIYQLKNHVEKNNKKIYHINFKTLGHHLPVKITNFDCAVRNQQNVFILPQNILQKVPLDQRHPYLQRHNFENIQQDYYSMGIILYWIFTFTERRAQGLLWTEISQRIQENFMDQCVYRQLLNYNLNPQAINDNYHQFVINDVLKRNFIPQEFLGLFSLNLNEQQESFHSILNSQYDINRVEEPQLLNEDQQQYQQ